MTNKLKIISFSVLMGVTVLAAAAPLLASGDAASCTFNATATTLCSPIKAQNAQDLVINVIKIIMAFISAIGVLIIMIAGARMVLSGGNETTIKSARSAITWAVIGIVVAILAYSIVAIVQNAFFPTGT